MMKVRHTGDIPTEQGQRDWFTGTVWVDELCVAPRPSALQVHRVSFEPGARTLWHSHPIGQVLVGVAGTGWIGFENEQPQRLMPGDTVWIGPAQRHWHGASASQLFVHLAVQEVDDEGNEAEWSDEVSDAEYERAEGLS